MGHYREFCRMPMTDFERIIAVPTRAKPTDTNERRQFAQTQTDTKVTESKNLSQCRNFSAASWCFWWWACETCSQGTKLT